MPITMAASTATARTGTLRSEGFCARKRQLSSRINAISTISTVGLMDAPKKQRSEITNHLTVGRFSLSQA